MKHGRRLQTIAGAAVLMLVACGGSEAVPDLLPPTDDTTLPLAALFPKSENPGDYQREVEDLIRICMAKQGFEYIPVDWEQGNIDPGFGLTPEEFRREFGYGIATVLNGAVETRKTFTNPNDAIFDALSPADQEAYNNALYGREQDTTDITNARGDVLASTRPTACINQAHYEVGGPQEQQEATIVAQFELFPLFEQMEERIAADPRLRDAQAEWSACLRRNGYDFDEPADIREHLTDEVTKAGEPIENFTGQEAASIRWDPGTLAVIQAEELALAAADYTCREEVDLDGVEFEVRRAYETLFVGEHAPLLDQFGGRG